MSSTVRVLIAVLCCLLVSSCVLARIPSDKVIDTIINTYLKENIKSMADSQASYAAQVAASYAGNQVGSCYSQVTRLGNPCFDCSGLVYMSYKSAGKTVPSSSSGYPSSAVYDVTGQSMEVGDILWRSGMYFQLIVFDHIEGHVG